MSSPMKLFKNLSIIAICHSIDGDNVASYIDQRCLECESCSLAREMMRVPEGHVVTAEYGFGITAGIRFVGARIQISQ